MPNSAKQAPDTRPRYRALDRWYESFAQRKSMQLTVPKAS
jgi:hypothetical protein